MVDALRRARRWVRPHGCVIDIHPSAAPALVEADGRPVGHVTAIDAPARHAAADAALAAAVAEPLFTAVHAEEFAFYTYGATLAELRAHVEEHWRDARIPADIRVPPGARPRLHEHVHLTKLVVAGRR